MGVSKVRNKVRKDTVILPTKEGKQQRAKKAFVIDCSR